MRGPIIAGQQRYAVSAFRQAVQCGALGIGRSDGNPYDESGGACGRERRESPRNPHQPPEARIRSACPDGISGGLRRRPALHAICAAYQAVQGMRFEKQDFQKRKHQRQHGIQGEFEQCSQERAQDAGSFTVRAHHAHAGEPAADAAACPIIEKRGKQNGRQRGGCDQNKSADIGLPLHGEPVKDAQRQGSRNGEVYNRGDGLADRAGKYIAVRLLWKWARRGYSGIVPQWRLAFKTARKLARIRPAASGAFHTGPPETRTGMQHCRKTAGQASA